MRAGEEGLPFDFFGIMLYGLTNSFARSTVAFGEA